MSENHPDGYLKHRRQKIGKRVAAERTDDFDEVWKEEWSEEHLRDQGERCQDCGVPTCMTGCPLGNIIPDWNDLVYRNDWKDALDRLHATNNFPEFTGYTCPAPCEDSCTLAFNNDPVTIKDIERAISDRGWDEDWIQPSPPETRTGHRVAVVGSGPAGMAAAQQLNRAGHYVTVFEADDEIGGLMTYGIPEFKFAKHRVDRRVRQMEEEGVEFRVNAEVGGNVRPEILTEKYDAVCIAIGSRRPFDLGMPGRELDGVHFALDFLIQANRRATGRPVETGITAKGKNVVVLGGGDTGADCVATAHRQGAEQVVQIELFPKPPQSRLPYNPWPEYPQIYKKSYAQEEGGVEEYSVSTKAFVDRDDDGVVDVLIADRLQWRRDKTGRPTDQEVIEEDIEISADLVLLAIGFQGPKANPFTNIGVTVGSDNVIETDDSMMTEAEGVFACGDARRGPSLVVWAIAEGRDAARNIDTYLTGSSALPASIQTAHPPFEP
jgi:glutamate synthase (NADPH/NADH) small chain